MRVGRHDFMRQFRSLSGEDADACLIDPGSQQAFERSKLDPTERTRHAEALLLHKELLRLRREDAVFSSQRGERVFGAVLGDEALALRYLGDDDDDRLVVVNLGRDLQWNPSAEPLLAPPAACGWRLLWSSEDPRYGGSGTGPLQPEDWYFPGHAAIVLAPAAC